MARETKSIDFANREKNENIIASHLSKVFRLQRNTYGTNQLSTVARCGKNQGAYITFLYLIIKVMYLVNVVVQLVILNAFLSPSYTFWGVGVLNDILHGRHWQDSGHFPRTTMCDFEVDPFFLIYFERYLHT